MNDKIVGYITADIAKKEKRKIMEWSRKLIKEENLYYINKKDKIDGGNVTTDLHLTLFYGLNENSVNTKEVDDCINKIVLEKIEIDDIGIFPVPNQAYQVLYFSIKNKEIFKKYHELFKKFSYFEEYQNFEYIPHITIAFVKNEFDVSKIAYNGLKVLSIEKLTHHISEK
jgi:2'-5' RNA ligase